ncbi:hypothetical protein GEU84_008640 [Fertoebacter nigrum]|uniref:Uncharacterized protein n=1 Tax=Fertoeibacter niger TaxID=2656921 RepID=A0A8X8H1I0_9RHOB|nr:hypothetical protein [Fertoeibacter niger]
MHEPKVILTLTINNSEPIELSAFIGAFTSIAKEYQESLRSNPDVKDSATIYVKEVRAGSIVADLIPVVASTLPIIATQAEQIWQAVEFVKQWGERIATLASGVIPDGFGKSELKTFALAVEAIARDPSASSTLEAATFEDGKRQVRAAFKFSTSDARLVEKVIEAEYKRIEVEGTKVHERVLMVFTRSDVNSAQIDKRSGERVVISEITPKDLPIIYASQLSEQRVKHEIRDADDNIFKKGFVVDVLAVLRGDRPIVFKILQVHDVIDLPDDDE